MNITITGKELKATEAIKDYVEKISKNKKIFFRRRNFSKCYN